MKNLIGIEEKLARKLAEQLNELLSNFELYYQNLRGFHWNITGSTFFELHAKFEELYNQANLAIDEIAERILTLNHQPLHSFSDFLKKATIKEAKNIVEGRSAVEHTLKNLSTLLAKEREILALAEEAKDGGTADLMTRYIQAQEKTIWMLSAYLKHPSAAE